MVRGRDTSIQERVHKAHERQQAPRQPNTELHRQPPQEGGEALLTHPVEVAGVGPHHPTIQEAAEALVLLPDRLEVETAADTLAAMATDHRHLPHPEEEVAETEDHPMWDLPLHQIKCQLQRLGQRRAQH